MPLRLKFTFLLIHIFIIKVCHGVEQEECKAWDTVVQKTRAKQDIYLNCKRNGNCTGVDCDGTYFYSGPVTRFQRFELDFCVGVFLDTFHNPMQIYLYNELPSRGVSHEITVTNTDDYEIPGAQYTAGKGPMSMKFTPYIHVTMIKVTHNGTQYARIGVKVKVKTEVGHFLHMWPSPLQREVIPETDIPIPQTCTPVSKHQKFTCQKVAISTTPTHATVTTGPTTRPPTQSAYTDHPYVAPSSLTSSYTYLKSCVQPGDCEGDENCTSTANGKQSVCLCQKDYVFQVHKTEVGKEIGRCFPRSDDTKAKVTFLRKCDLVNQNCGAGEYCSAGGTCLCLPGLQYVPKIGACNGPKRYRPKAASVVNHEPHGDPVVPVPASTVVQSGPNTKVIIIAVSVTGGVILLSVLLLVVVYKYIKFKRQYGGHELLLQEEDVVI